MVDKRYQVFVSSTYEDLIVERQEVIQALLELKCIPAGMELFPADDETQWEVIKRVIDDCDYYIVIIGGRYGSIGTGGISYTEMEYHYAESKGILIIAFPFHDLGKIERNKSEIDPQKLAKLENFIQYARKRLNKNWTDPKDLGGKVSRSIAQLMNTRPRTGWVKADNIPDMDILTENVNLRKKIEELESKISSLDNDVTKGIEDLAQGEDKVNLEYFKNDNDERNLKFSTISINWNEVMKIALPTIDALGGENQISYIIKHYIITMHNESNDIKVPLQTVWKVTIQLRALKIIKRDKIIGLEGFYKLTPYGEKLLLESMSIRKSGKS